MGTRRGQHSVVALLLLLLACAWHPRVAGSAAAAPSPPKVAIIGGGIGGTAAAYFLRQANPEWHLELFERECIGGRTREVTLDGKVLELGASIIHCANKYMLSLAREMNLTLSEGDDTGAAFSIWDGSTFVFSQIGNALADLWAVAKRYGINPLKYKWLSQEAGRRFAGIYDLQAQGTAFSTPEDWLRQLDLLNVTQQQAAEFMQEFLTGGLFSYGSEAFIEELAGAINRVNYNQNNVELNALAGLVSYLPAADPEVYSIAEGNAALPTKLAQAAQLQGLHLGAAVQSVMLDASGQYTLAVQPPAGQGGSGTGGATAAAAAATGQPSHSSPDSEHQQEQQQQQQQAGTDTVDAPPTDGGGGLQEFGPYAAVIIATPLEGSGLTLHGLHPQPQLPQRRYQQTTTSFVTGYIDATFFDRASIAAGDVFVTNSAKTPFSVVASKGGVRADAVPTAVGFATCSSDQSEQEGAASHQQQQQQEQQQEEQQQQHEQQKQQQPDTAPQQQESADHIPLWKVFSEGPLSWHMLRTLFVNGTVVASKTWAAYPRFQPPEKFAPFTLSPGLCYNSALENAASAMEVAAVAAKNCALLVQQHVQQQQHAQQQQGQEQQQELRQQRQQHSADVAPLVAEE